MALIDARLHAHGIQGLRVVDGSVMSAVILGNVTAAVIAIGEQMS
jgi:choline dehydrogenase